MSETESNSRSVDNCPNDSKSSETCSMSTTANIRGISQRITSNRMTPFMAQINDMLSSIIRSDSNQELGLRNGFYNSIAFIFLLFVLIVIYYCYWILKPFLQPLLWAILCGSALHRFKQRLYQCSLKWIRDMSEDESTITLSTLFIPIAIFNKIFDFCFQFYKNYMNVIHIFGIFFIIHCFGYSNSCLTFIYNLPINNIISQIFVIPISLLSLMTDYKNSIYVITLVLIYLSGVSFMWTDTTDRFFSILSPIVWFVLCIHLISLSGTFGYVLSTIIISITILGLIKTITIGNANSVGSDQIDGFINISLKMKYYLNLILSYISSVFINNPESIDEIQPIVEQNVLDDNIIDQIDTNLIKSLETTETDVSNIRRTSLLSNNGETISKSNFYIYAVLWAVVFVQIISRPKLIFLALIPITCKLLTFGSTIVSKLILSFADKYKEFIDRRRSALFNPLIKNFFDHFLTGDKLIKNTMKSSLNGLTSLIIIFVTLISVLFFGIFMSIQIYGESLHLVNSISNVFNKTISNYPESSQLLPQRLQGVDGMLDEVVKNGYEYGREYIKNWVQNALNVDGNVTKTIAVEKQILEIWDRAYHLWLIRNANQTDNLPQKSPYQVDKLQNALKTVDLYFIFNILKQNIDFVISVLDSLWLVLKGNVNLLLSAFAAVFSILLGGGLGLMNLLLSFIIFTTALFYLLALSGKQYKPVELINRLFPSGGSGFSGEKFGRAVEEAINGVFAASLKMSTFYGLYTYLIHTLFDVNIVYIPSIMAAIFGTVPFLSAFWASFPAFLELFFVQNQQMKAVLLMISAYFPSFFVDSTIYSEIKSAGHPYLTGLAIAGGVFYLGFEGAVFGPILLCFLIVAFNIYTSIVEENRQTNQLTQQMTPKASHRPLKRIQSMNEEYL